MPGAANRLPSPCTAGRSHRIEGGEVVCLPTRNMAAGGSERRLPCVGGGRRPPGSNDRGAEAEAGMSGGGGFPEGDGLWASP